MASSACVSNSVTDLAPTSTRPIDKARHRTGARLELPCRHPQHVRPPAGIARRAPLTTSRAAAAPMADSKAGAASGATGATAE